MHPVIASLLCGPAGYALAGRKRRAIGSAGLAALAALLAAYLPYLQIFAEVNWGGDSPRELVDTTIVAARIWLASAATWAPAVVGVLLAVNAASAVDLALFARSPGPEHE